VAKGKVVEGIASAIQEMVVTLIGRAPVLVAHMLPWDHGSYWDEAAPEVAKRKIKRPSVQQAALLKAIGSNGYNFDLKPYDSVRGLDTKQETILRGWWLPDHGPAFPVDGFKGAIATGAVQYNGKNYGLSKRKLLALELFGDDTDVTLARIETDDVSFDETIGRDAGRGAPRPIVRIRYGLPWQTTLRVRYNPSLLRAEEIAQALMWAGDFGIGQRRPSSPHGGQYGTFKVAEPPKGK